MKIILFILLTLMCSMVCFESSAQQKPPRKSTKPPLPSAPQSPPPPIITSPQSPGAASQAGTLKVSTKKYMEMYLLSMKPAGNKEQEYLHNIMFLQYRSIDAIEKEYEDTKAVREMNKELQAFDEALQLMHNLPKDSSSSSSNSKALDITKTGSINQIQQQILSISTEYKASGKDPNILAFADRMISKTKKED